MSTLNLSTLTLALALEADFEQLVAIRIEAMRESLERVGRYDTVRARERFRAGFSAIHTRHILVDQQQVGFVVVKLEADQLQLENLYIRPSHQGQGIGKAVLVKIFEEADTQVLPVSVSALRDSAANRFYQRHGFQFVSEEEWDIYYIRSPR